MAIKTVEDIDLQKKRVIVRCDFNVPLDEHLTITDEKRIVASLPTIRFIRDQGTKLILMSHMGRPKGKHIPEMSLAPVAASLSRHLNTDVIAYQRLFQLIEQAFVDFSAQSQHRRKGRADPVPRFAQSVFEESGRLSEYSHTCLPFDRKLLLGHQGLLS